MHDLKCLVVDDSALSRRLVRMAVDSLNHVEVVDTARDGIDAIEKCSAREDIDLVTMDLEMPRMDGIQAVRELRRIRPKLKIIMVSSLTGAGADVTNTALRAGAFDFVLKPVSAAGIEDGLRELAQQLDSKIAAVRAAQALRNAPQTEHVGVADSRVVAAPPHRDWTSQARAICIGVSTGGPSALQRIIPALPADLSLPVFIVQHMPPVFTKSLAEQLDRSSRINVLEAQDGMRARPGYCYIAPGGTQMGLTATLTGIVLQVTDAPAECNAKPSVDYLFRSAAQQLGNSVIAVVLTGMGNDGQEGCKAVKRHGGHVVTQDESSCVVYGMPKRVCEAGCCDRIVDLEQIATYLSELPRKPVALCR